MKEFFEMILSHPLGVALVLLPLAILAKNFIGAGGSVLQEKWNFDYLKRGLFKGLLIYIGIAILAFMTTLSPELSVSILDIEYTVVDALVLVVMGAIIVYVRDTFVLLGTIFKQKTTIDADFIVKEDE